MGELLVGWKNIRIACGNGNSYGLGSSTDDKYVDEMVFIFQRAIPNLKLQLMLCRVCLESRQLLNLASRDYAQA